MFSGHMNHNILAVLDNIREIHTQTRIFLYILCFAEHEQYLKSDNQIDFRISEEKNIFMENHLKKIKPSIQEGERHWAFYYTSPQSFLFVVSTTLGTL